MTRLMADTVDPTAPPGYDLYAGYIDGAQSLRSFRSLDHQYPGRVMSITVVGNPAADVCDVESGDVTPGHAPGWVQAKGSLFFGLWVAGYSFKSNPLAGAFAWQRADHGPHGENIDVSEVYDYRFGPGMTIPVVYCPMSSAATVVSYCNRSGLVLVHAAPVNPGPAPAPPPPHTSFARNKHNAGNPTRSVRHHAR